MLSNTATRRDKFLKICEVLSEQENLKVTVHESSKGALWAGIGALAGGLLGGPVGLAIGGSVGSITGACRSKSYKSVVYIIQHELTPDQKLKLGNAIKELLGSFGPEEFATLLSLILTSATLKEAVLKEIGTFFLKELSYSITS